MMNLYELTNEFRNTASVLEAHDLDPEVFQDTLDSMKAPIEEKVENIVKYVKNLEALAEAKKAEAKRLSESAAKDLNKVEWFKNYMTDNLQKANISKLQAGVFALSFRKGSEVVEIDESRIPSYEEMPNLYKIQEPKFLGKSEIKTLIKASEIQITNEYGQTEIPGVSIVRKPDTLVVK